MLIKKLHLQYTRGQQLIFWRAKESWVCNCGCRASLLLEWCWLVAQEFVHMYKCGEGYMILLPYGLDSLICQLRSPKFKFKKTTWYYLSMIFFHAWCFCEFFVLRKIFNCSFHISLKIFSCEFFLLWTDHCKSALFLSDEILITSPWERWIQISVCVCVLAYCPMWQF